MSQFPGPGANTSKLSGILIFIGLGAVAYRIHPWLFWAAAAVFVGWLVFPQKK